MVRILFIVWLSLWLFFLARGIHKGEGEKYMELAARDHEEKISYILGEGLYGFMNFCFEELPSESTYGFEGEIESIDKVRLAYQLYPHLRSNDPEYLLCYKVEDSFTKSGYFKLAIHRDGEFILKRLDYGY